ncbi:MAG TPA: hypothetical protein VHE81_10435, partial [Lacipirellulaceae bacterium]|nr:hypothetical protein [Lacipirellulaceae bacterium]
SSNNSIQKDFPPAVTPFAYPRSSSIDLRFSRKCRKLADEMSQYAADRCTNGTRSARQQVPFG